MKVRISGETKSMDLELPVADAKLAWRMGRIMGGSKSLWCTLEKAWGEHNPLQMLAGQKVNMDELNFLAKRMDSLTKYEQGVLEAYACEKKMGKVKDLINLTYSMKGLSLISDFSDAGQVGRRLYMDENAAVSKEEEKRINFSEYGEKKLAESDCKILPCGVLVTHGFEMREIYNGRTFPEYVHDGDKTVAVLKMKNRAGDSDYLYLPTDICSVSMMKDRLQVQELCGCRVEEVHNLRLPESLVPEPQELKSVGELTYFNEMCRAVCGFNTEKMERLAMAAEFVGSKKYTDITCVAKRLDEFEITPSVHSNEEYGKFLVTESGLFEVDDLLLPHIDYAGFAADKRSGTQEESGYVQGGFVGTEKKIQEYLGYKGEYADPLEKEEGCYEMFCLYSPLHGTLTVDGNEGEEQLSGSDLIPYREEISRAILDDDCIGMEARGLMYYFSRDCGVAAKVVSAWPSVCDLDGELYGVLVCEVSEPLEENEVRVMKNYWTGQMSDGWGEGFEQHPIRVRDGEICVSFWDSAKYWNVMTAEELGIKQEEVMGMSL